MPETSWFESQYDDASKILRDMLHDDATYTAVNDDGTTTSFDIATIFNEQVGFIDERLRAVFTVVRDDLAAQSVTPKRGDYIVLDGETLRWTVTDVRDDKAGMIELRCDALLDRQ